MRIKNLLNSLSRLFFWWTIKLFRKGAKGDLKIEDIDDPLKPDKSKHLGDLLERNWEKELEKYKQIEYTIKRDGEKNKKLYRPSLLKAIIQTFWRQCFYCGVYQFFQTLVLQTMQPIFQGWVINYFEIIEDSKKPTKNQAFLSASGLIIATLAIVFITHHMNLATQRIGMQVRIACSSLIYRKSLKLSQSSLDNTGAGQIINLLSNDIGRFDTVFSWINYLWIVPIQISLIGYIIWTNFGVSSFVGMGALIIISFPMLGITAVLCSKLRKVIAEFTDQRVQLMSELVAGMQVVKMYAWEEAFNKIVSNIRRLEIKKISISSYFRGFYLSLMVFTERTILYLTIITFILMGNTLTAELSFQLASYFNTLQLTTAIYFPTALIMFGETLISVRRIENFLLLDEISKYKLKEKSMNKNNFNTQRIEEKVLNKFTIEFKRVSANWIDGQLPPTLCNVSFKIEDSMLCSLIGPVGSGKSSLLSVLLKELPIGAGTVEFNNLKNKNIPENQLNGGFSHENFHFKISYASQNAWLFSGTVRENILFGQDYDRARYQQVTKVCSLMRDFKQFAHGDMTIIGERGASLSGGQRARINLARAIYQEADVYLLDDPLSAVDTRIARRLFKDCIVDFLKGKTRILVTHQLHFSKQSDMIILLDRGIVKYQGRKFDDLIQCMEEKEDMTVDETNDEISRKNSQIISQRRKSSRMSSRKASIRSIDSYYFDENDPTNADITKNEDETMASGKLSSKIYIRYFRAGGGPLALLLLTIFFITAQIITSMTDYWLSYLTTLENSRIFINNSKIDVKHPQNSEFTAIVNNSFFQNFHLLDDNGLLQKNYAIIIYTILIIACIISNIIRVFFFMSISMRASIKLHNEMFSNILSTTMFFFNSTPMGRILNRFSKDIGALDESLPRLMLESLQIFTVVIGIMAIIVIINSWMLIPIIVIAILFYNVRTYFLQTAQDLKRLEGIAKSPVFSHVSTTLNGLPTIRSHSLSIQEVLIDEFDKYQDSHTGVWYLILSITSAFGLLLDVINCIFIACVCYSFILMDIQGLSSGSVGLAISQCLILTGMLQHGVRESADVQSQMTAVERILQYTELPKEEFIRSINSSTSSSWPSCGNIEFKNVSMSYKINDPPVLKNLNVTINEMEKVGIVGRTGAGKSSLISALFRLTDANCLNGEIIIDGINICKINLQELRSNISIIPQEPVLFSQSLRYNLDPFNKYKDSELWNALEEVEMSDYRLDEKVTEGGTNFSVGERQLICLARAILRNNKILVLDEATANIDLRTDALIQRTIRAKFSSCTVITIAHRLDTIIDSDRVIVMDNGNIVEFDSPFKLLVNKPNGYFSQMVQQMGNSMAEKLLEQATKHKNSTDI